MKPELIKGLDHVKGSYQSIHGTIESDWTKKGKTFNWTIIVPENTTAEVYIPASSSEKVKESGNKASSQTGVKFIRNENNRAVFEVGSGVYSFSSEM